MTNRNCNGCRRRESTAFAKPFTMAFQPIIDLGTRSIWGYEALVRGTAGETAAEILDQVTAENRYRFDQECRVRAIELAAASGAAGSQVRLSINFMPNAVYEPAACIRSTLTAAAKVGFDPQRIVFEFTENEPIDVAHVSHIVREYKRMGFLTALMISAPAMPVSSCSPSFNPISSRSTWS